MKPNIAKLMPTIVRAMKGARERRAQELLNVETVRLAIHKAAESGLCGLRLRVPDGIRVDGTTAALKLEAWGKGEGFIVSWEKRFCDLSDGRRVTVFDPEFNWTPDKLGA